MAPGETGPPGAEPKLLIAHRGASGSAPEHTIEAYRLAIEQGADFIEPDLQISRDGVLICLHDPTLERTTDVSEVFPARFREAVEEGRRVQRWHAVDFTLEEIQRLDAGAWFHERYRGARVPTLADAIDLALGRAGVFPETKAPDVYGSKGFSMEHLFVEEIDSHGLARRGAEPATPIVVQSFSTASLEILRSELGSDLERVLLVEAPDREGRLTREGLVGGAVIANGIGPAKALLAESPDVVRLAHDVGLSVFPWTFRATEPGTFANVTAEMAYYLYELGVDGLFTNDPNRFPRTATLPPP